MSPQCPPPQERLADNKEPTLPGCSRMHQEEKKKKNAILPQFPHLPNGNEGFTLLPSRAAGASRLTLTDPCVWGTRGSAVGGLHLEQGDGIWPGC